MIGTPDNIAKTPALLLHNGRQPLTVLWRQVQRDTVLVELVAIAELLGHDRLYQHGLKQTPWSRARRFPPSLDTPTEPLILGAQIQPHHFPTPGTGGRCDTLRCQLGRPGMKCQHGGGIAWPPPAEPDLQQSWLGTSADQQAQTAVTPPPGGGAMYEIEELFVLIRQSPVPLPGNTRRSQPLLSPLASSAAQKRFNAASLSSAATAGTVSELLLSSSPLGVSNSKYCSRTRRDCGSHRTVS